MSLEALAQGIRALPSEQLARFVVGLPDEVLAGLVRSMVDGHPSGLPAAAPVDAAPRRGRRVVKHRGAQARCLAAMEEILTTPGATVWASLAKVAKTAGMPRAIAYRALYELGRSGKVTRDAGGEMWRLGGAS